MGLTPVYNWPYPELNSTPDGATQMKNLALAIENSVKLHQPIGPLVQVRQLTAQNITTVVTTSLTMDGEDYDTHGMHSNTTNPARLTCLVAGIYKLDGGISWAFNATGRRVAAWAVNGVVNSTGLTGSIQPAMAAQISTVMAPSILQRLVPGDYVELQGYHDAGVTLATASTASNKSWALAQWVAA
jgi:hypothetical protein